MSFVNTISIISNSYRPSSPISLTYWHEPLDFAKRISLIAIPIIGLYRPLSKNFLVGMNIGRTVNSFINLTAVFGEKISSHYLQASFRTAFSVSTLALTILAHPVGMFITVAQDFVVNSSRFINAVFRQNKSAAFENLVSLSNNVLSLWLYLTGSIHLSMASMAAQTILGIYTRSRMLNLKTLDVKNDTHVIYIHGILNDRGDTEQSQRIIQHLANTKTKVIWTPTHGFSADIIDAALIHFDITTQSAYHTRLELEKYIKNEVKPHEKVLILTHSKGGLLTNYTLKHMAPHLRKNVKGVISFGSAQLIKNYPNMYVRNIISRFDPVPFIADPLYWIKRAFKKVEENVVYAPTRTYLPIDHLGFAPTYRKCLKQELDQFYKLNEAVY